MQSTKPEITHITKNGDFITGSPATVVDTLTKRYMDAYSIKDYKQALDVILMENPNLALIYAKS